MPRFSVSALAVLLLLLASGCDGPVGAIDREDGITAEVMSDGIRVTNEHSETIYVVAYGEDALLTVDPSGQTVNNPGRAIQVGETIVLSFSDRGLIRRSDDYYVVSWITVKGTPERPQIGPRGQLELER